jgi:cardiolipin synthase
MPVKYASREAYDRLLSLGIEVYEYQPTMMHTKSLVVDEVWSMFGSANFDNRSLELNDELNVAVSDRDLARRFIQDFEQDLRVSSRLELAQWRQRGSLEKAREKFWSYFGEIF